MFISEELTGMGPYTVPGGSDFTLSCTMVAAQYGSDGSSPNLIQWSEDDQVTKAQVEDDDYGNGSKTSRITGFTLS